MLDEASSSHEHKHDGDDHESKDDTDVMSDAVELHDDYPEIVTFVWPEVCWRWNPKRRMCGMQFDKKQKIEEQFKVSKV